MQHAVGTGALEAVPIFNPYTRDVWLRAGPQPIADAIAHVASATTSLEADAAVRELVAIVCRWLAVLALSAVPRDAGVPAVPSLRDGARGVVGRDDAAPWLELARAAVVASGDGSVPGLVAALAGSGELAALAHRIDDRDRARTAASLGEDIARAADALRPIEPLLAYQLVVGRPGGAESWQGARRRDRDRVVVWGEPLADGEVALLDAGGRVIARLSPLAQVIAPLPSAEPELFLIWRSGRGAARLVAAPWGFERDDDAAGRRLAELTTDESDTGHDPDDDTSPYPGLAAYGRGDAERFVGREREVEALANRLIRAPMIAVLGPSGAGKSSFIHAGVLPRLAEHYHVIAMRPGRHPMQALAAIPELAGASDLAPRLRELGESGQRGLVLVVDQLEELVTLCGDAGERRRFADTLAAAADATSAPVRVVVTLRDDFAAVIESEASLRGRFEVFVLGTPLPEALRRIVIEPARHAAVAVDPAVVDDIVAEVAGRPASLPLLSFTAAQLWDARDRTTRRITRDSYLALGGVAGALSTYADQIYGSLAHRDQEIVRALFARLVAGDGTRIPAPRRELEQLPGAPAVLAHLIDARLLVVREDDAHDDIDIVEIVHECLAERWDRLARWRREDAADRALVGDVRAAARRWLDGERRPDALWRGEALLELRRLVARGVALTGDERAFSGASEAAERRARRVRGGAIAGAMIALAAVAAVTAALGLSARTSATLAEDRLTHSLLSQGIRELDDGRELHALAYFAEALERGADSRGLRFMLAIATRAWRDEIRVVPHAGLTSLVGAGDAIAGCDPTGRVRWWNDRGEPIAELATDLGNLQPLIATRDGGLLGVGEKAIVVIDARHHLAHTLATPSPALTAGLGPNPDEIVVVDRTGIAVRDARDGHTLRRADVAIEPATFVQFDASHRHALVSLHDRLDVYDLADLSHHEVSHELDNDMAGADDGSVFGYVGTDRAIHLVAGDGHELRVIANPDLAYGLVFSPTGDRFGAVGERMVAVFEVAQGSQPIYDVFLDSDASAPILRGDDVWFASATGSVHHVHHGNLVASDPVSSTGAVSLALAGNALAVIGGDDDRLTFLRADAAQLELRTPPCPIQLYAPNGPGVSYQCGANLDLVIGRDDVGGVPFVSEQVAATRDAASKRTAVVDGDEIFVFGSDAKPLATSRAHVGAIAFANAGHLWVAVPEEAIWQWTLPVDGAVERWDRLAAIGDPLVLGAAPGGGMWSGTVAGDVQRRAADGRVTASVHVGDHVTAIVTSPDGRVAGAQLASGELAIIDAASVTMTRLLAASDSGPTWPSFDATGELVARTGHAGLTIWEPATGRNLVFDLDLFHDVMAGRFLPDGRIEVTASVIGVLDLPFNPRPVADIVRDIRCRVPLAVGPSGQLVPARAVCP